MPRAGPRKVQRYSLEFKLKAVKLSQLKGVEVQAVAAVFGQELRHRRGVQTAARNAEACAERFGGISQHALRMRPLKPLATRAERRQRGGCSASRRLVATRMSRFSRRTMSFTRSFPLAASSTIAFSCHIGESLREA